MSESEIHMRGQSEFSEDDLSRLIDDPGFGQIHSRMARFNLFEAVGAVRAELRHSNFLAYLLSPGRSHGLGAEILVSVLRSILELLPPNQRPIMTLELIVGDVGDAIVYRERDHIDLLVDIPSLNLVVAIENKVDSKVGDGQLDRYHRTVERGFRERRKLYVYLTPAGADPDHASFIPFSYGKLADVLDNVVERSSAPSDASLIVRHYVEMLRRHIVPDERLRELAARLYERHSEALDFIFECRPQQSDLLQFIQDAIEGVSGLSVDSRGANVVRFVPDAWDQTLRTISGDAAVWTRTGRALLFEVKTFNSAPGRVNVSLLIGPAAPVDRAAFYEAARNDPNTFVGLVKPMGAKWVTIFSRDLLTSSRARDLSAEQQASNVLAAWSDFQGKQLQELINAILEIDAQRSNS